MQSKDRNRDVIDVVVKLEPHEFMLVVGEHRLFDVGSGLKMADACDHIGVNGDKFDNSVTVSYSVICEELCDSTHENRLYSLISFLA